MILYLPADPLCVRETCGSSLTAWTLPFFETGSFQGRLCFATGPSCMLVCTRKQRSPNLNITSEPFTQTDLSHHFASLTELLYREKRVIFVLLLSVLFLVQCFQTDWKAAVFVCVCVWMYEWVCIYINVRGCVAACVCLWWKEAPFFSNKEMWRQPKISFSNTLSHGSLIECVSTCYSDRFRHGGVARVEELCLW